MGMVVRTNTMSSNAYRQLGMNNTQLSKSLEKLSSGYRINRAGDDASGLAISEKMKSQIAGLEQASSNSQDGISLVQTAEGALTEVHSMLNRMVELATKSSNGTIQNQVDRDAIQSEVKALSDEITRVSKSTDFNGIQLLDGTLGSAIPTVTGGVKFDQVAATANTAKITVSTGTTDTKANAISYTLNWADESGKAQTTTITFGKESPDGKIAGPSGTVYNVTTTAATATQLGAALAGELGKTGAASSFNIVDNADGTITLTAKTAGATGTAKVLSTSSNATGTSTALTPGTDITQKLTVTDTTAAATGGTAANYAKKVFTIDGKKFMLGNAITSTDKLNVDKDVTVIDIGAATYTGTDAQVSAIANALKQQTGENYAATGASGSEVITYTPANKGLTLQVGTTSDDYNKVTVSVSDMSAKGLGIDGLDVSNQTAASAAIDTIKSAINTVSTTRGNLGALQNRLEHAINNLDTTAENMNSANSAIRDTDMAKEMMNYTKNNILSQAAQAMLAQANQQPQNILQLLK